MTERVTGTQLRTVGVLGGMSSASTREYYRRLDEGINEALGGHGAGDLLVRSVNFADVERFIRTEDWDAAGEYLARAARDLEAGGAEFVIMATNTMHRVAPRIVASLSIPFVHIVDVTADAITAAGVETVGVLGTEAVMTGSFYHDRFAEHGITTLSPEGSAREDVDRIIFEELTKGTVRDESRARYLEVIDRLTERGAEGVVLGCTEIDLLVDGSDRPGVALFDTTSLHVERAVEYSLGTAELPGE